MDGEKTFREVLQELRNEENNDILEKIIKDQKLDGERLTSQTLLKWFKSLLENKITGEKSLKDSLNYLNKLLLPEYNKVIAEMKSEKGEEENTIKRIAFEYLTYDSAYFEDNRITEVDRPYITAFNEFTKNIPKNGINYAKEVKKLIDTRKINAFTNLAKRLHQNYVKKILELGIIQNKDEAINYNCFRWHIAKQLFLEGKKPSHSDYPNKNPFTDIPTQEFMVDVMVGWNYIQSKTIGTEVKNLEGEIEKIYEENKKDGKEIPSWAYARIGKILR